jgi:hypothetical protein
VQVRQTVAEEAAHQLVAEANKNTKIYLLKHFKYCLGL